MFFLLQQIPSWFNISCWFSHPVTQLALSCRHSAGTLPLLVSLSHVQGGWGEAWQDEKESSVILLAVHPDVSYAGKGWDGRKEGGCERDLWWGRRRLELPLVLSGISLNSVQKHGSKSYWKISRWDTLCSSVPQFFRGNPFSMAKQTQRLLTPMD